MKYLPNHTHLIMLMFHISFSDIKASAQSNVHLYLRIRIKIYISKFLHYLILIDKYSMVTYNGLEIAYLATLQDMYQFES
jgi:hypothetical protein